MEDVGGKNNDELRKHNCELKTDTAIVFTENERKIYTWNHCSSLSVTQKNGKYYYSSVSITSLVFSYISSKINILT